MPRYSLYVSSETSAEFVVNVELSRSFGTTPWPTTSADGSGPPTRFVFSITLADTSTVLVEGSVPVNSTRNVFGFPFERGLGQLVPRLEPYRVVLYGAPPDGTPAFLAESQFVLLPDKEPGNGSVTRLDNLNGGLWHKSNRTGNVFQPFLPYGYYAQASWMTTNTSVADVQRYAELGFNAATPLAQWDVARDAFAEMERLDIRFMYNFRDLYRNLTELKMRIPWARDSEALFAWWSTDE